MFSTRSALYNSRHIFRCIAKGTTPPMERHRRRIAERMAAAGALLSSKQKRVAEEHKGV
uniref:Uncharacterized protein n=1 Tax=Steinernema glaseri TaxID=37863 RepID=A0A1I7Y6J7_9BILA